MTSKAIIITLRQAEQLLAFFGGHDAEITVACESPGLAPGLYAWLTDDPGEGSAYLGPTEIDDELANNGRPGPVAQLDAVMKLADSYAHCYAFVDDDSMPKAREALHTALQAYLPASIADLHAELARLHAVINEPHTDDFLKATSIEKEHQRQRWGDAHDRSKSAEHWYWLVGYLAGKALRAAISGDRVKALHHTISSAAALANWHDAIAKDETGTGTGEDVDLHRIAEPRGVRHGAA